MKPTFTIARWLFALGTLAVCIAAAVWLAGFIFFVMNKANPLGQTELGTWLNYWEHYQDDTVVKRQLLISMGMALVVSLGAPAMLMLAAMREVRTLHGEARFANQAEISKAGLFSDSGVIVGKRRGRFLMYPGSQFVLLAAPTRSGKGVGVVIPNLLNFSDSAVVLDVKLENFMITSKYRAANGQKVFLFNPFSQTAESHRYNPLGYISDDPRYRITDILSIGYALYPGAGRDAFFEDAARNLFLGLCLYLCETPKLPRTIGELLRQSSGKGQPIKQYIQGLIEARNFTSVRSENADGEMVTKRTPKTASEADELPVLSMECVDALNRFTSTSDNTLSSILASFNVPLTVWSSPIVDAATAANDFDLRLIRKQRMTVYIGIPANKLAEAELIINLFFSQLINLNTDELLLSRPELKYQCLLLMDEFSAPGRIGIIDKSNAYMAGYGLRLLTVIQSSSQIEAEPRKGYGREGARALITNHACQIIFAPREQKDANDYSEMLGTYTFKSKGRSRQLSGKSSGGRSESESDQRRALLLPQELKEMSQQEQIINLENSKPIRCEKVTYFTEAVFIDRLKSVSSQLAALGNTLPTKSQLEVAWGSGDCAVPIPRLNLASNHTNSHSIFNTFTASEFSGGVGFEDISADLSNVKFPSNGSVEPNDVERFVTSFFDALDGSEQSQRQSA